MAYLSEGALGKPRVIAIDGPVAAGKTVVGKRLSKLLGYRFIDTGSMYRAITWLALKEKVPLEEEPLSQLAHSAQLQVLPGDNGDRWLVNGQDVTAQLRTPEVERKVPIVAQFPGVRQAMVAHQRKLSRNGGVVMAGRDIGTVVLPEADLKVFLLASVPERARRRYEELRSLGRKVEYQQVLQELETRDRIDSQRAVSPLRPAPDAHILETDCFSIDQVVERILSLAQED